MFWLWLAIVVVWSIAMFFVGHWLRRREDELLPQDSTLSEPERAQAQLGIAMTGSNTFSR